MTKQEIENIEWNLGILYGLVIGFLVSCAVFIISCDYFQSQINDLPKKVCHNETEMVWNNITLESDCGETFYGADWCYNDKEGNMYFADININAFGIGCDKGVQLIKVGDKITAMSNKPAKCYVEIRSTKEVCTIE